MESLVDGFVYLMVKNVTCLLAQVVYGVIFIFIHMLFSPVSAAVYDQRLWMLPSAGFHTINSYPSNITFGNMGDIKWYWDWLLKTDHKAMAASHGYIANFLAYLGV